MSLYKQARGKTFRYDFKYEGVRYRGNTKQTDEELAELHESDLKRRLRENAGGMPVRAGDSPRFQDWAKTYIGWLEGPPKRVGRVDAIAHVLRVVLRFWGDQPAEKPGEEAPRHDLRLEDPIRRPELLDDFDDWIRRRGVGPQMRKHYLSVLSRLYRLALVPKYRRVACVQVNPIVGIPREAIPERTAVLSRQQLHAVLRAAPLHIKIAVAIGALAPGLRLQNVLGLEWRQIDVAMTEITVANHKTAYKTKRPLISPISNALRAWLILARASQAADSQYVVTYQGDRVYSIRTGLISAFEAAGVPYGYGRDDGATFHTLRHAASSVMGEHEVSPLMHSAVLNHKMLSTTARYTHIAVAKQLPAHDLIADVFDLADPSRFLGTGQSMVTTDDDR